MASLPIPAFVLFLPLPGIILLELSLCLMSWGRQSRCEGSGKITARGSRAQGTASAHRAGGGPWGQHLKPPTKGEADQQRERAGAHLAFNRFQQQPPSAWASPATAPPRMLSLPLGRVPRPSHSQPVPSANDLTLSTGACQSIVPCCWLCLASGCTKPCFCTFLPCFSRREQVYSNIVSPG